MYDDVKACADVRTWVGEHGVSVSLTAEQIAACSHPGRCDDDVESVIGELGLAGIGQLAQAELIRRELREWGAWDDEELKDAAQNIRRLVWIAAGDLAQEVRCAHCGTWARPGDDCPECGKSIDS
jgi:ribosomal protein L32